MVDMVQGYRLMQLPIQDVQLARNWSLDCTIREKLELIYLNTFDSNHLEKLNK